MARAERLLMQAMRAFTGGALLLLLVAGLCNIALRWSGESGLIWYNDLARFGLVWATLIGAAIVTFQGDHLVINDTLVKRFPPRIAAAATVVRLAATILFLAVVLVESVRLTAQVAHQGFITVNWLSLAFGYAALPVATALMLIALLGECARRWRNRTVKPS